jgi:hypothetical protein
MLTPRATSDDKQDPAGSRTEDGRPVYFIKRWPERSQKAEEFIRRLDCLREDDAGWGGGRVSERARIVPENGQRDSIFKRLATDLPVDYFDPAFFNQLPAKRRALISTNDVVFPENLDDLFDDHNPENGLDSEEFADTHPEYVSQVLASYKLVELGDDGMDGFIADEEDEEEEEEEEDEDEENEDEDEEMVEAAVRRKRRRRSDDSE